MFIPKDPDAFRALMRGFPAHLRPQAWAFFDLALSRAQRQENGYLKRGELYCGREEMAAELGISQRCFRTLSTHFRTMGITTSKTTNKGTILSIISFDVYVTDLTQNDQQNDQPTTNQRPTNDHSLKDKGKGKEETDVVKDTTSLPAAKGFMGLAAEKWKVMTDTDPQFGMFGRWKKLGYSEPAILEALDQAILHNVGGEDKSIIGYVSAILSNSVKKQAVPGITPELQALINRTKKASDDRR